MHRKDPSRGRTPGRAPRPGLVGLSLAAWLLAGRVAVAAAEERAVPARPAGVARPAGTTPIPAPSPPLDLGATIPPEVADALIPLEEAGSESPPEGPGPDVPLGLEDAIRQSLANVETIQANVAVQTATVARFEALKEFVPLVNLPQLAVAFNQLAGPGKVLILPDVTGGALLEGSPGLQQAALNRANLYFPMTPSGHITALPIAEEGIYVKVLMEQLVRRSQMMLAIQGYYQAKQIDYGVRTARLGVELARESLKLTERKLRAQQAHDVDLTEARVAERKTVVLLTELEKEARVSRRELAVVLHQSRLLIPQQEPLPVRVDPAYRFDLAAADEVDLRWMPDFPGSREEAMQLAKQQRVDVRLRVAGLRIARLQQRRNLLNLFGEGRLPAELGFKNTNPRANGGITLGAIFGSTYGLPLVDVGLWSGVREARLDVVLSQLELERALLETAADAGNSWDRWQQSVREWELSEAELELKHELLDRVERLYEQRQSIWVEVLAARVGLLQADANRWTKWFNLQLARFDVLRSTEQLLDYADRRRIAHLTDWQKPPDEALHRRWLPWLATKESARAKLDAKGGPHATR